jgi:glucose/arabinose dehydrogenase
LFNSNGRLVRLVDANGDGVADAAPQTLYTGLPGVLDSVRTSGNLVFATSSQGGQERISILRMGATPSSAYTLLGSLNFSFPAGWEHTTYAVAVADVAGSTGSKDLYFNIGSQQNFGNSTTTVGLSGMATGTLNGDSIYRVRVTDFGGVPAISNLQQIASGLRNAAGMFVSTADGSLYIGENGIDTPGNLAVSFSADELNRITAANLGGAVDNFGFPTTYIEYGTGNQVGNTGLPPLTTFQPLGGSKSEGIVEIVPAPAGFPVGMNNGVFATFHGDALKAGIANAENPLVYYDLGRNASLDFISNDDPIVGHPQGVLSTTDSLFFSDLSSDGGYTKAGTGVIYQIKALPAPTPGDANRDGVVNGLDYISWADHFQQAANFSNGDYNRDGIVDGLDYILWADNFSTGSAVVPLAVPEPASWVLALSALGALVFVGRRGRHMPKRS